MMRVGFGVSALCKGLAGGGLDGIGHYTREMLARFNGHGSIEHGQPDPAIKLVPFAFGCPVPPGLTGDAGVQLGRYSVNAARSVLTGANFLGIDRLAKQVDLIHATDHYVPRCKSVPIVATLMDAIPLSHPQWLRSEWRAVKNMLWKRAANWADSVITISDYSKVELSRWAGIPLERITVIPLAVDDRWFHDVSQTEFERVRAQYALPNHFFVSVGTLQPRKNVETTIRAHRALTAAERQRTPLLIIGRAGWKCEAVMRLIEEESDSGVVRWLQHLPDADLLPVLKLATSLVFPSLGEGFGLPVLEAFAAQVPVITSNTTSLPEVTGDAAVSLDPMDVDAIARAMKRLSEDSAFAEGLKQRGVARARQFTWQKCADATLDVYRRVLAK